MNLRPEKAAVLSAPSSSTRALGPLRFEDVFRSHVGMVTRVLRSMGVQPGSVDDAAQDVFLTVHRKLGEFEGRSKLSTWICSITYRVGFNYRRRAKKAQQQDEWDETLPATTGCPETHAEGQQSRKLVERFCADLEEPMRDVFALCFLEERPPKEVSELLEVSANTIYSRIRLLRAAFRRELLAQSVESQA